MKSEQRATRDETRDLAMPRQGVSLLNAMLDHGGDAAQDAPAHQKALNNINRLNMTCLEQR